MRGRPWRLLSLLLAVPAAAQHLAPNVVPTVDLGGLETRSAALILSGQQGGDLAISVLPIPLPATGPRPRVEVVVDILGGRPELPPGEDELITEVYAYALTADQEIGAFLTRAFTLDLELHGELLDQSGVKFLGRLELDPGTYSLRVLVLERQLDRMALRAVPLVVPEPGTVVSPPLFPEPPERWLLAQPVGEEAPPFPLALGDERAWVPSTRPVLDRSGGSIFFVTSDLPSRPGAARLVDPRGEAVETLAAQPAGELAGGGRVWHRTHLAAPSAAPGEYLLELAVHRAQASPGEEDGEPDPDSALLETSLPVWVAALPEGIEPPLWSELRHRPEALTAMSDAEPGLSEEERASRLRHSELARSYIDALRLLAAGDLGAARTAVVEIESAVLRDADSKRRGEVATGLLAVAGSLARVSNDSLIPLLHLYEELYRLHHRQRRFELATHARQIVVRLGDVYAKRDSSESARRWIACAMVSVGGYLQEVGSIPAAQAIFELTLDYHEDHAGALLGLAAIHESYGDYGRAVQLFNRLLDGGVDEPEVRLRLAINLVRQGDTKRAERLLRSVLDSEGWPSAVAHQELAQLLASTDRGGLAVPILEGAIERWPAEMRPRIQLAALLDRLGRMSAARQVLQGVAATSDADDSPRLFYSRWPEWAIEAARRDLAEVARAHHPTLAEALGQIPYADAVVGSR